MANKAYNGLEWAKDNAQSWESIACSQADNLEQHSVEANGRTVPQTGEQTSADTNCSSSHCATPKGGASARSSLPSATPPASLTRTEAIWLLTGYAIGQDTFKAVESALMHYNRRPDSELESELSIWLDYSVSIF